MSDTIKVEKCRSCGTEGFIPIISLGNQYVTNFVNSEEDQKRVPKVPLNLVLCDNCKLLQLEHNAPPESMWGDQYWYKSGISSTIVNDLKDISKKAQEIINLGDGDTVLDIGCNDGTLLNSYNSSIKKVGFEPSKNVSREAIAKGLDVINNFFNANDFRKKFGGKKAKIITAISMFYDLEDPNQFLQDIVSILDKDGLFVIQQNYLLTMLENNAFDNICHEHREYYSLISLKNILDKHGLEVFDIEQNEINGGSIRTYIRFKGNDNLKGFEGAKQRIEKVLEKEHAAGLNTLKPYLEFADRILGIKEKLVDFLRKEKDFGKKIWIYGASTRGNVILQYFRLDTTMIEGIADKNLDKEGKKTVGSLIPIFPPEEMRKENPDYLLVNTWHFLDEIKKQEDELFNEGCKFVVALPEFKIYEKN